MFIKVRYPNSVTIMISSLFFKFNEKHFVQTHGIAMGTKMAVALSVIFMEDLEKRLLAASPLKPFVWKRFITLRALRTQSRRNFINTNETLNKDSVTEAIPRRSFIKS